MNAIETAIEVDGIVNRNGAKARPSNICRALVNRILDSGAIIVQVSGGSDAYFTCDVLLSDGILKLKTGDSVLVVVPSSTEERGVVLGLVGPYRPPAPLFRSVEHLTVEATESLQLKCGESSIELREEGVLIKGKDIVSRARRIQKIKGGTVAIN